MDRTLETDIQAAQLGSVEMPVAPVTVVASLFLVSTLVQLASFAENRHGLVEGRKRRRYKAQGTLPTDPSSPNKLWCADFKGEFMLGNRKYCYPLTITDYCSRYLLACESLESTKSTFAFNVFERVFKDYGLPTAIRTDNGLPFASPNALFGLSKLAVWWLRLGIGIERIKPGHPQQNGRHERMHLTLKKEATKPASFNFLQQQMFPQSLAPLAGVNYFFRRQI
jgi:transposase InsO family protein